MKNMDPEKSPYFYKYSAEFITLPLIYNYYIFTIVFFVIICKQPWRELCIVRNAERKWEKEL